MTLGYHLLVSSLIVVVSTVLWFSQAPRSGMYLSMNLRSWLTVVPARGPLLVFLASISSTILSTSAQLTLLSLLLDAPLLHFVQTLVSQMDHDRLRFVQSHSHNACDLHQLVLLLLHWKQCEKRIVLNREAFNTHASNRNCCHALAWFSQNSGVTLNIFKPVFEK